MNPYYADESVTLYAGDCLDVLRTLPDNSVDAVVTDPPYNLTAGKQGGTGAASVNLDSPYGRSRIGTGNGGGGFMGKGWDDYDAFPGGFYGWCEQWATECLRVLKPGGHLLAFGGTRTWHRLACAVEDAGFEIRDSIAWLYGSGFPKSLDVSKAIDKRAEVNDEMVRRVAAVAEVIRTHREAAGLTRAEVSEAVVGTPSGACWNWEHQQLPSDEIWPAIKGVLGIPDKFDGLIIGDRAQFIAAEREVIGARTTGIGTGKGAVAYIADSDNRDVTAPATADARTWQGWGTALKPAFEPVVVARKPLTGTVAANVLAHGTGALNIDGCRVGTTGGGTSCSNRDEAGRCRGHGNAGRSTSGETFHAPMSPHALCDHYEGYCGWPPPAGRWPANVVLDGDAAAELDRQSGTLISGSRQAGTYAGLGYMGSESADFPSIEGNAGGASRFYYTAKAPTAERPRDGQVAHPTVKPLALMRWLVRLVTPSGGLVLDPFAGSGTTAEACVLEHLRCITIEREETYLPLIVARLSKPLQVGFDFGTSA